MDDLLFGLRTALVGMAIVFSVLAIVWALLTVLMKLDARAAAAKPAVPPAATTVSPAASPVVHVAGLPHGADPKLIAAITVAILRHEEARRLQAAPAMRSYWPGSLLFASRWVAAGRTRQGQSWRRRR